MNSFFSAIRTATDNNKFPELGDTWRTFHPNSDLSDIELGEYADLQDLPAFLTQQAF